MKAAAQCVRRGSSVAIDGFYFESVGGRACGRTSSVDGGGGGAQ